MLRYHGVTPLTQVVKGGYCTGFLTDWNNPQAEGTQPFELKAQGQHEGQDTFEKRFAIAQQLEIGRFAPEIDGDGAVFTGLAGTVTHGHPSVIRSRKQRRYNGGNALKSQGHHERLKVLPLKAMECGEIGGGILHRAANLAFEGGFRLRQDG